MRMQAALPRDRVVHCKSVGSGNKALVYVGRYLSAEPIQSVPVTTA